MPALPISWTRRLYELTGLATVWVGVSLLAIAVVAFLIQELVMGRFDRPPDLVFEDVRLTLTHMVITAYMITAAVYCEQARDESIAVLSPLVEPDQRNAVLDTKQRDRAILIGSGAVGAVLAVGLALYVTPGRPSYDPRNWNPENGWHRVLSVLMGYWSMRLSALILIESGRLSNLATRLREIDLLDLDELSPFVRRGLTNALLIIGSVSVYALFLIDRGYLSMVLGLLVTTIVVGGMALLLPLRGVRSRIQTAKRAELSWCRGRLRQARTDLASGDGSTSSLQDLVSWEARVERINEWPVDASTFARFALYLLIPLGSWAGGAIVERLLDSILD